MKSIELKEKLAVCQQIARLVRAKLPIAGQLKQATQNPDTKYAQAAEAVDQQLLAGHSLAATLANDASRDSRILAACIETGEMTGALDSSLQAWTEMHIANSNSSKTMRSALLYPILLIAITILSLSSVIWSLIPQYRETYALFDKSLPSWLETIVWFRENFGPLIILLIVLSICPLVCWALWHRRYRSDGLPVDLPRRLRLQALSADLSQLLLGSQIPLTHVARIACQACGAEHGIASEAFHTLQKLRPLPNTAPETSMLLASVHAGVVSQDQASNNLSAVATHLRQQAESTAARQARWIPMLVALTVGLVTMLTYVLLIYLPWLWLMQEIGAPVDTLRVGL